MCNQLFTCHLLNGNIFINEIGEILPMNEIMEITEKCFGSIPVIAGTFLFFWYVRDIYFPKIKPVLK